MAKRERCAEGRPHLLSKLDEGGTERKEALPEPDGERDEALLQKNCRIRRGMSHDADTQELQQTA